MRRLFEDATDLAAQADPVARTKATLLMDLSVEQVLSLLGASDADASDSAGEVKWPELWRRAAIAFKASHASALRGYRELSNLHKLRNLVQHAGLIPPAADVDRYLGAVLALLVEVYRGYGLHFQTFRPWDLMGSAPLAVLMQEADEARAEGFPFGCAVACAVAHRNVIAHLGQPRRRLARTHEMAQLRGSSSDALGRLEYQVLKALESIQEQVAEELDDVEVTALSLSLGLPAPDTIAFLAAARRFHVGEYRDGRWHCVGSRGLDDDQVAEMMISYMWRLSWGLKETWPGYLTTPVQMSLKRQPIYADWLARKEAGLKAP